MKHHVRWISIACVALIAFVCVPISCKKGDKSGVTATTFNRRFIPAIKPAMTYEQIAKIVGAPGAKIGENRSLSPPTVQYRWNGSRDSILTIQFGDNRMIDATVLAPNGHTYLIQNNGEVADITK
jgi:hypothetical protein